MKVTVRDCLQLESFRQCIVVAGERSLDNRVKTISVLDAATIEDAKNFNGNSEEMVLTSFSGMKESRSLQCETVRVLAKSGIAAMAVFQKGNNDTQVPKELINAADEAGLPLLIMVDSEKGGYSRLITEVMDQILYGSNFRNSLINNTVFHLLNFEKHSSFQQALREAAISNDFQVVLLSEDFNPVLTIETRMRTTVDEAIVRGKQIALNLSDVYSLVEIDGVLTYWGIVTINSEKHYMLVVDNEDNYSSGEITKLAEIIELAMGMWKYTPERDARAEFAKALIRGNKSLAYSLKEEAGVKPGDIISVFHAKGIETPEGEEVLNSFRESGMLSIIRIAEGDETFGILFRGPKTLQDSDINEKAVCTQLFDQLKARDGVRIFHVTGNDGIEGAGDGFRLINETWSFVEGIFPYKRVFSKYELVLVSNCINIQVQGGNLKMNYMELLEPFSKEGDNKSRQLLDTLETFVLDAGMNSSKTSEFMGIHTNTVQYRLKKINEVLGAEITGNRVIPGLTVALALKRLERVAK
ncbi:MAG: PucR family transcriptional regulator [Firmicutes bacterium]|nr:PucR family transcriptional regulator [Bacillota bacterium]